MLCTGDDVTVARVEKSQGMAGPPDFRRQADLYEMLMNILAHSHDDFGVSGSCVRQQCSPISKYIDSVHKLFSAAQRSLIYTGFQSLVPEDCALLAVRLRYVIPEDDIT